MKPRFSQLNQERLGILFAALLIPSIGCLLTCCLGVIGLTDESFGESLPMVLGATWCSVAPLSVIMLVTMGVQGRARARQAFLLDEVVAATGGVRPAGGAFTLPRAWCAVEGHEFEVVQYQVGRAARSMGEVEDGAREAIFQALDVPSARIPRGRHWRITVYGGLDPAFTLVLTAKGPLALALNPVTGIHKVMSGDAQFDAQVVVMTDRPEATERLLADPERRDTLRRVILSNGNYVHSVAFQPRKNPTQPGVTQKFVLHSEQTGAELAELLKTLVRIADWLADAS